MDEYKILSGDEVVMKGGLKASLPEIGLKDVTPTGSWLEQKQIQSALEARKHLIEVQRIEKSGVLTHAEWCEDLKLAEVTQQAGGYWQFLGHCKDNKLYLRPEEALFLMEVNCLLLRYNEVIVSLQQAYSLLLSDETSIFQYKVYASLSRLGYKVFRHIVKPSNKANKPTAQNISCEQNKDENLKSNISKEDVSENNSNKVETNMSVDVEPIQNVAFKINVYKKECNTENKSSEENEMVVEDCNFTSAKVNEDSNSTIEILNKGNSACKEDVQEIDQTNSVEENKEIETVKENITSDKSSSLSEQNPMDVDQNSFIEVKDNFTETSQEAISQNTVDGQLPDNILSANVPCEGTDAISSMVIDSDKITSECSNSLQESVEHERIEQTPRRGSDQGSSSVDPLTKYCQWKLEKLKNRQSKCPRNLEIHNCFKNCPDISENQVITVNTPKDEYLPKNVFLNKISYVINVANITSKNASTSPHSTYSLSDDVNGAHVRRVTNVPALPAPMSNIRSPLLSHPNTGFPPFFPGLRPNMPFRHYNIWRPRPPNMNYFQFNLFFQRPYMANFNPRFQFYPRMHTPIFPRHCNSDHNNFATNNEFRDLPNRSRKRPKDSAKIIHLENLKIFANRIKGLSPLNSLRSQNINAIQNLIQTYNMRFRTRLRLSEEFDIIDDTIVDTITLDDEDEERRTKKPRLDGQTDFFVDNLNKIRQTALRLKKLENKNKATARHRRALSSVIKTFNKYFKADIHMTDNYEVLDRRHINLDSSSDSDCVVEEAPKVTAGKKLRNPFNILKKLAEKQSSPSSPTTSRQDISESSTMQNSQEVVRESFKQAWLPNENDFGRPELISRDTMTARFIETKKEELLFDFLKNQTYKFNNWIDLKIAFLESVEETNAIFQSEAMIENNVDIKSLITSEDCSNMTGVLKKLAVINSNKNVKDKSLLTIDYDVYNRDVKQFRKSNRPKPHFRVLCIEESSPFPSGIDIATLHATIEDDVPTVFAVVGINSISYVQLNPTELDVYMPCTEMG